MGRPARSTRRPTSPTRSPSRRTGSPPHAPGRRTREKGRSPRAPGKSPRGKGTSPRRKGTPTSSTGRPSHRKGSPSRSAGRPSGGERDDHPAQREAGRSGWRSFWFVWRALCSSWRRGLPPFLAEYHATDLAHGFEGGTAASRQQIRNRAFGGSAGDRGVDYNAFTCLCHACAHPVPGLRPRRDNGSAPRLPPRRNPRASRRRRRSRPCLRWSPR